MGSESDTIAWIRNQLDRLTPQNAHHEFEHLCRRFARAVLTPNLLPATGPVSAGGDQGRDFESFHTYAWSEAGSGGGGFWATSDDRIAFACSLEKRPERSKIKNDVAKICEHEEGFVEVVFFSSQDIAVGKRNDLARWARDEYGVALRVFDGDALAERLACEDVFHVAQEFLTIPESLAPSRLSADHRSSRTPVVLPPVDIRHFQGRAAELGTLERLLAGPEPAAAAGVWGAPGIGKSALAVAFASRHAEAFPDGVFGVDLRGRSRAEDIVRRLMASAGETLDEDRESDSTPAELLQTHFGGRRCILILDNVEKERTAEDSRSGYCYRHLIPHGGRCRLLVTSSDREVLTAFGLPIDAQVELRGLEPWESRAMLEALVDETRVSEEEDAVRHIGELTGDLPLALRLVAGLVANDVGPSPFRTIVDRLLDPGTRIDELSESDSGRSLRSVLKLSLERLGPKEKRTFAQLSVCIANGFSRTAALAAADLEPRKGRPLLSRLVNLGLLEYSVSDDRFRFHPLIHILAVEMAGRLAVEKEAARRFEEYFFAYVRERGELNARNVAELIVEEEAILAVAQSLASRGRFDFAFLAGLNRLLEQTGNWAAGASLAEMGRKVHLGNDRRLEAVLILQAGKNYARLGDLDQAIAEFERSLQIGEELGDRRGIAMVLNSLGGARRDRGDLDQAIECYEEALAIQNDGGFDVSQQIVRSNLKSLRKWRRRINSTVNESGRSEMLAEYHWRSGKALSSNNDHYGAVGRFSTSLKLNLRTEYQAPCLFGLAQSYFHLKNHQMASIYYRAALSHGADHSVLRASFGRTLHELGSQLAEIEEQFEAALAHDPDNLWASSWYALALCDHGMLEKAEGYARRAVAGNPDHSILLTNLARVLIATGYPEKQSEAETLLKKAMDTAPVGFRYPQELLAELREQK